MRKWILFAAVCLLLAGCNNAPIPQNTTTAPAESTGTYQEPTVNIDSFTEGTEGDQSIDISDFFDSEVPEPTKPDTSTTENPTVPNVPEPTKPDTSTTENPTVPDVPETTAPTVQTTPEETTSAPSVPQPDSDGYQTVIVRP